MKKILIVDDNDKIRNGLAAELQAHKEFRVFSKGCAKTAAQVLQAQPVDFLITELDLPEISGLKLISYVKKYSPDTHVIAVTDFFSDQQIEALKDLGVSNYFNKPVKIDSLVDSIFERMETQPQSGINGLALASFLQLMNLEQKTCILTLNTNKNQGVIHFMNGEIIEAQTGELNGKEAFYKIMEWNSPNIKITTGCHNTENRIHMPLMHLLMESQQRIDELGSSYFKPPKSGKDHGPTTVTSEEDQRLEDSRNRSSFKELVAMLSETPDISDYEIYDDTDLLFPFSPSNSIFAGSPLEYFSLGDSLGGLVGSRLKYSKINRTDRSIHVIGKFDPYIISAKLNSGTNTGDIIHKIFKPLM